MKSSKTSLCAAQELDYFFSEPHKFSLFVEAERTRIAQASGSFSFSLENFPCYKSFMANLFLVATPIGNLKDITLRALEVLKSVDLILAEDTRVTKKLLSHYDISRPLWRFDENIKRSVFEKVIEELKAGKNIALVTDAGTPGIYDPGQRLLEQICVLEADIKIVPIPGSSALAAMISASDINLTNFTFFGFPPHKKGRETLFKKIAKSEVPVIMFESPHRILKTFDGLLKFCGDRWMNVGRELTKIHEEVWRGKISEATGHFKGERERGEFVIVISSERK